jgi:hypothetical protein
MAQTESGRSREALRQFPSTSRRVGGEMKSFPRVLLAVMALVVGLIFGGAAPGDARTGHNPAKMRLVEGHLKAHIVEEFAADCPAQARRCAWVGDVRIVNLRPAGTGRVHVCVGIDVFTDSHDNLTEGTSLGGQVSAWVRPGHPKVKEYKVSYRVHHSRAVGVEVTAVRKYGNPC